MKMGIIVLAIVMAMAAELRCQDDSYRLCTREGMQCKDCHTKGNCVKDGNNGYKYGSWLDVCPGDVVCDETTWHCEREGFCRFKKFECPPNKFEDEVIFPDPYTCTSYHGCQGTDQFDYLCKEGKAFDPVTKLCSLDLEHKSCQDNPIPPCEKPGETGTIAGTDFFYECVEDTGPPRVIYPRLSLKTA